MNCLGGDNEEVGLMWGFGVGIYIESAMEGLRRYVEVICYLFELFVF